MRKLFVVLMAVMMAVSASANLSFLGVEMTGTLDEYAKTFAAEHPDMTNLGLNSDSTMVVFMGNLPGKNIPVTLFISASPITHTVYEAGYFVYFRTTENWAGLMKAYNYFKNGFTNLYGAPFRDIMKFDAPYSESNKPEEALLNQHAQIESSFGTGEGIEGFVDLSLYAEKDKTAFTIFVHYTDYKAAITNRVEEVQPKANK